MSEALQQRQSQGKSKAMMMPSDHNSSVGAECDEPK